MPNPANTAKTEQECQRGGHEDEPHDHEAGEVLLEPREDVLDLEFAPGLEGAARDHEAGREHGLRDLERDRAQDRDEVHDDRDHDDHEDRDDPHERRLHEEPPALGDPLDARAGRVPARLRLPRFSPSAAMLPPGRH